MPLRDTVWFVPFDAQTRTLQPVYVSDDAPIDPSTAIDAGKIFTVSLQTMKLAEQPDEPWYEHLLHPHNDILIITSSALGSKPMVQRVHFYKTDIDMTRPLLAHDLLSDVIWVCDDYKDEPFYLELKVVTIDRSDEYREAALRSFSTVAATAGSIFPVTLPYAALGEGVLQGLNKMWEAMERRETYRISEPIKLFPPGTPQARTIRPGQYVVVSEEVDGAQYQLGDNCQLVTSAGAELGGEMDGQLSYAVIRIDPVTEVPVEFVVSQRVATLLTQLRNDQEGLSAGALQTSLGFLTDTLKSYTNFTDLQRYQELLEKGGKRTDGENQQMRQLEQREELKPFLPKQ